MACTRPLSGWLSRTVSPRGGRPIVFNTRDGFADQPRQAPCGVCPGCRGSRAGSWGVRASLELQTYPDGSSCFITLTYDAAHLPPGGSLDFAHLKNFWKRLRKDVGSLRYLACGEYGERSARPHYHAVIFGWRPSDLLPYDSENFVSATLQSHWPFGSASIGGSGYATYATAVYTAAYAVKGLSESYPAGCVPPDLRVSTKPALGSRWIYEHAESLYHDQIYVSPGVVAPVPKHLLSLLEDIRPDIWRAIKSLRAARAGAAAGKLDGPTYRSVEANILARRSVRDFL